MKRFYKDDFKRFIVCPKLMWLLKNRRIQSVQAWSKVNLTFLDNEREKDFQSQFQYQEGQPVDADGMRAASGIWFEQIVFEYMKGKKNIFHFEEHIDQKSSAQIKHNFTKKIIESKQFNAYYQPYFCYQNFVTKCDLIFDYGKEGFDLYEVKAVNKIEGRKRTVEFSNDLLYQCWILDKLGYKIRNIYILHLDPNYSYQDQLDVSNLFKVDDSFNLIIEEELQENKITKKLDQVLTKAWEYSQIPFSSMQSKLIDHNCQESETTYCTQIIEKVQSKYNWLQLYRLQRGKKAKFYLENLGKEINLETISLDRFQLTDTQLRSVKVIQGLENIIKERERVLAELKRYQRPVYFYDFETVSLAIPRFENANPWMQIPFQYSIHILTADNDEPQHLDYIFTKRSDPRKTFIHNFAKDIQKFGPGTYVAYNVPFERMILLNMLNSVQMSEQEIEIIKNVITETIDLMNFFKGFNIYHKDFFGSISIKKTLPALVPAFESSYRGLKIQKGDQASAFYFNYLYKLIDEETWLENMEHLRQYCKLDSLAMVKIYEKIIEMVK